MLWPSFSPFLRKKGGTTADCGTARDAVRSYAPGVAVPVAVKKPVLEAK